MAEWLGSALVQEVVSRGATFGLARCEEKASQGHLKERLEMAANEMEHALERSAKLRITDVSLLQRRKMIKRGYLEAMELLNKHNQQAVPARQELQVDQRVKRKRWVICATLKPFVALSTDDVRRFEWFADRAGKFVRDVESGCSLHHNTFCNPIVRHLLEGITLFYYSEHGNLKQGFFIWPTNSVERGVEACLGYVYNDSTVSEKSFSLRLVLRLSESTDIIGAAINGFQLLTSRFKLVAECAIGELTLLSNSQDFAHFYQPSFGVIQDRHTECIQLCRPDPACCEGSRHGLCASNNVSSELSHIFPEQVIYWLFECYYVEAALEPRRSSRSSFDVAGRRKSRGGGKPPLMLTAGFAPHMETEVEDICAVKITRDDVVEYREASIEQAVEAIKSDAITSFFRHPELTKYKLTWLLKHAVAWFSVEKLSTERLGAPKTKRRYNTRGSTRRSSRR